MAHSAARDQRSHPASGASTGVVPMVSLDPSSDRVHRTTRVEGAPDQLEGDAGRAAPDSPAPGPSAFPGKGPWAVWGNRLRTHRRWRILEA